MPEPDQTSAELANAPTAQATPLLELPYTKICISLYHADHERLDALVAELKRRGLRRANASWLIRYALAQLDVDAIDIQTLTKAP